MDIGQLLQTMLGRMNGLAGMSANPFTSDVRGFSPFSGGFANMPAPKFGGLQGGSPFKGTLSAQSPFQGRGFNAITPFRGVSLPSGSPFRNPLGGLPIYNPYRPLDDTPKPPKGGDADAPGTTPPGAGLPEAVSRWYSIAAEETAGTGIDPDILLALISIESEGVETAQHPGGASGLLQLMPGVWGPDENPLSGRDNIRAGVRLMKQKIAAIQQTYKRLGINRTGREFAIDIAKSWLGGFDYNTGGSNKLADVNGTTGDKYAKLFASAYDAIKSSRSKAPATSGGIPGTMSSIWGGVDASLMQEFGETPYSRANPYNYGGDFGQGTNHHGLDVGLTRGTRLYSPGSGVVVIAGNSGYFRDDRNSGAGELRIRLDNGDEVILGHMSQITARVGQRVKAGDYVGLSGSAEGDHLHLEWRVWVGTGPGGTGTGWRAVDPRTRMK